VAGTLSASACVVYFRRTIDLYKKDAGKAHRYCQLFNFEVSQKVHVVILIATESAVTPAHITPSPLEVSAWYCGSLSNGCHNEHHNIHFETDNDTEAAYRFLEWPDAQGTNLGLRCNRV